jgi:hypothetical protein
MVWKKESKVPEHQRNREVENMVECRSGHDAPQKSPPLHETRKGNDAQQRKELYEDVVVLAGL